VEMSDGNALFLEELIRMAAEERGEEIPETVLAVLQARLSRMEPGLRQVLLAASVFGRTFWPGGVMELLGRQVLGPELEHHLRVLVEQEVISLQPDSHVPSEAEYRFRHALVRDAAYALVPDSHRPVGHRLAADWLERGGEADPLVLATHYQLGQQLERAAPFYTRAAEQLFERHDLPGTLRCVEAALSCGVGGEAQTRLRALQTVALIWMNQLPRAVELGGSVVDALKAGSSLWCRLMGGLVTGYHFGGHQEQAARARELLLRTSPEPEATAAYAEALTLLGASDGYAGLRQRAEISLGRIVEVNSALMEQDALVRGWMGMLKGHLQCFFEARPWQMYLVSEQAVRDFSAVGMERNAHLAQASVALALATLGEVPRAVELLRKVMADIQRMEQLLSLSHVRYYLIHVLLNSSEPAHHQEGHALVLEWLACHEPDVLRHGIVRTQLAKALMLKGEPREAETHARHACELLTHLLTDGVNARTVLSTTLLAQGRATEARQVAVRGVRELEQMRSQGVFAVAMYLALAEACFAEGDTEAGEAALRDTLRCVRARADDIPEAAARERFLSQVPENARTLALARQRWGDVAL